MKTIDKIYTTLGDLVLPAVCIGGAAVLFAYHLIKGLLAFWLK
jgi:hypothetical protein